MDAEGGDVSLLVVAPDFVTSAAADLESIRSALDAAHAAAAAPTTRLVAAGADEVSAAVAALFAGHGQEFQALSAQASAFHQQFVQALTSGAGSYLATEAANASPLQTVLQTVAAASPLQTVAAASPLQTVQGDLLALINAPTEFLLGRPLISTGSVSLGNTVVTGTSATVPLRVVAGTEPVVNASVGSGSPVPLLVDTGSTGLVIPFQNVGGILGTLQLGFPRGIGIGAYSGGLDYLYATYNAPVNFGGGLVTSPTPVDVEFFAWPTSIQSLLNHPTFQSFFASDGAAGVLGIGPNAGGPGPSIATQALPSPYNQGVLINQPAGQLVFEAQPAGGTTLTGSPITNLNATVGGTTFNNVPSIVDSGGVDGTIPSGFNATPGTTITVSANGTTLDSYTYGVNYFPTVTSGGLMNTGNLPFQLHPVYINYGADTTTIY